MKIGIFAGTFDPIHNGHLAFATEAIASVGLDKVIIVAEKEPYRKQHVTSWDHRQAMIERATTDLEHIDHDYQFAAELALQHTLKDTLEHAKKHYGDDHEVWFLVGSDIFEHVHEWQNIVAHKEYGGFIVALRKEHTPEWVQEKSTPIKLSPEQTVLVVPPYEHISSSKVRSSIRQGEGVENIPGPVRTYILDHNLYT